jgi:MFS family permease
MIRSVEKDFDNSKGEVNDVASGIFNTALGVGQVSGPLIASFLTNKFGFRNTTDFISIYALGFCLSYFIFGNGVSAVKNIFKPKEELDTKVEAPLLELSPRPTEIEMNRSLLDHV